MVFGLRLHPIISKSELVYDFQCLLIKLTSKNTALYSQSDKSCSKMEQSDVWSLSARELDKGFESIQKWGSETVQAGWERAWGNILTACPYFMKT